MPILEKPCDYCQKPFSFQSWEGHERKCCSYSCRQKLTVRANREKFAFIKMDKRMSNCKECNKEFWQRHNDRLFCGRECYLIRKKKDSMQTCEVCSMEFYRVKSTRYKYITCSKQCRAKLGYINKKIASNNVTPNSSRRLHMLNICGTVCKKCNSNSNTQIHHVDCNANNNPESGENWITLCRICHLWVHREAVDLGRYLTKEEILSMPYKKSTRRRRGKRMPEKQDVSC